MKKNFQTLAMIFAATAVMFTACEGSDDENGGNIADLSKELKGEISEDYTVPANSSISLDGPVHITEGATLTIEEGVTITAKSGSDNTDYLLVEQGAQLVAKGTKDAPIVMTSDKKEAGAWGGIHICGKAKLNAGGTKTSEVGDATYGGGDDTDCSGSLEYVRVEYAGQKLNPEGTKEANGVSFYGVGSGTKVSHVQAIMGNDDGFEFFGGCVNVDHLISTSNSDDSFDWTGGWRGNAQFLVAYQESFDDLGYACDKMMECDNDKSTNDLGAADGVSSFPTISNVTFISENDGADNSVAIRLRAGTEVKLYNAIVAGKTTSITVETARTDASLAAKTSILNSVFTDAGLTNKTDENTYTAFATEGGNKADFEYTPASGKYVGVEATGATALPSGFAAANYVGAVEASNDWTAGWSKVSLL